MQFNITTMLFNLLQAAIDTTALAPATPVAQENTFSLIEMAVKGGWLMLILLILSIIAIYIFGNKWWMIRKAGQIDKNFMKDIHDQIHDGKIKSAIALCQRYDSPVARLVEKGIERIGRPLQDIQAAVENMGNVEVARLEKGLPMLATIAGGAPMIGFLGTVTGMIRAFFEMANAGNNIDITLLRPSSTRLEARFPYHGSGAMTRCPSPLAWRHDFPGAPREAH